MTTENTFATLNEIKDYLDIDRDDPKYNYLLDNLLEVVTDELVRFLDRDIFQTTYHEYYDIGYSQDIVQLNHYPVISISGITNNTVVLTTDDYKLYSDVGKIQRIDINLNLSLLNRVGQSTEYFYNGYQALEILYDAGYATANIPKCLKMATMQKVHRKFYDRSSGHIKSQSTDGISFTKADLRYGLDPETYSNICHLRRA